MLHFEYLILRDPVFGQNIVIILTSGKGKGTPAIELESLVALTIVSNLYKDLKAVVLIRFDSTRSKLRAFLV